MKMIDGIVLGPAAKHLWREMRKKRYELVAPASAMYMMLPYMNLSPEIGRRVIMEEIAEGRKVWSEMTTTVNGRETTVSVCRQWGAFLLPAQMIVLSHYPLQGLNIEIPPSDAALTAALAEEEPIAEEKTITPMYRVTNKESDSRISFAPVHQVHKLDTGALTELVNIDLNLNEKLRRDFSEMKVGDEREFTLGVKVLTGYRLRPQDTASASS